jgi:NAD(P)-dependent dehydrogenase (short-subunit alcohol dehydrogenase family)
VATRAEPKRTVLVTGANRGIGLAAAEQLAKEGFRVVIGSRDFDAGEQEAARLRHRGADVIAVVLDVASPDSIDQAIRDLEANGVIIDALINNAGILNDGRILELSDNDIANTIAVHITGPLRLIRKLAPSMIRRGYGRIVNVSSGWGSFAEGIGPGDYGVTKAALNALTVRLAKDQTSSR